MAAAGSAFNWVTVRSSIWTKIWQGPLVVQGVPYQFLELAVQNPANISRMITWTLDGYSAAPPFYQRSMGTSLAPATFAPPIGYTGSTAVVLAFLISPWVEFNILTNSNCTAHIVAI
ncbi:hypothetical protein [Sphingomonas sp. LaA6.9]|uniref:hypothetical protein n=1 Tax=Sphingomonas sp. LaA6.9 TaxID=2919914 RepID=UPI001F4FA4A2|nr:hypothetical protein [Sphingomonas sp. LaA6.9]MCJ8156396.1 hypothetical protein [Sphingomonas sp. LaA6.9]